MKPFDAWLWFALGMAVGMTVGISSAHALDFNIVTASERGTYIQIGKNLAEMVAKPAGIDLGVLPSAGSVENVKRLRYDPGIKLAIVQSDVFQAYLDEAARGERDAADIIKPLRVILPLYDEEIYLFVSADSPLNFIHEIRGHPINIGPLGSGTALTMSTIYPLLFGELLPEASTTYLPNEEALVRLTATKTGVVAIVGGQPTPIIAAMKPEAKQFVKMLKLDPSHTSSKIALQTYFLANVRQISYPNLLAADQATFAVKAFLVTYDFTYGARQRPSAAMLVRLAKSLCENFDLLQEAGHSKWRDVRFSLPDLGSGWLYYEPTVKELRQCVATRSPPAPLPAVAAPSGCSQHARVLGLCR